MCVVLAVAKLVCLVIHNQYEPVVGDFKGEKQRNLEILEKVLKSREVVDANKAANQLTAQRQKR